MKHLAKIAGKRRCCSRGTCIHRQAKAAVEKIDQLQKEIERLKDIITGAYAHSYGPYSDKELLRRVVAILETVREAAEAAGGD